MNKNVVNILIFVFFLQYLSYAQPINEKTYKYNYQCKIIKQ